MAQSTRRPLYNSVLGQVGPGKLHSQTSLSINPLVKNDAWRQTQVLDELRTAASVQLMMPRASVRGTEIRGLLGV